MTFIETIPEAEATGAVGEMYEVDRQVFSELPNFTEAFSLRPEVYAAWRHLNTTIKANMDLRRYELATVAAARRLRSSYCTLAHGSVLVDKFLEPDAVRALVDDFRTADLEPADLAVMELADKVAHDATSVTQGDVDQLRDLGLTDPEIFDVVVAAAARCFFSKTLDALGAEPDAKYSQLEPELRNTLTVGRPIAQT
ncbi:MAG: carboxymuconolactone decarboxylase family protein [Solirubrobacteraceae bacterium]